MPRLCAASLCGSTSTRTAYLAAPNTLTCATPLTIEIRCAIVDSAYSLICDIASVPERSTRKSTGWSPGFTLLYDGGDGICGGSCRVVRAIIDWTSCAAASMFRLRSNCSVMLVNPSELVE